MPSPEEMDRILRHIRELCRGSNETSDRLRAPEDVTVTVERRFRPRTMMNRPSPYRDSLLAQSLMHQRFRCLYLRQYMRQEALRTYMTRNAPRRRSAPSQRPDARVSVEFEPYAGGSPTITFSPMPVCEASGMSVLIRDIFENPNSITNIEFCRSNRTGIEMLIAAIILDWTLGVMNELNNNPLNQISFETPVVRLSYDPQIEGLQILQNATAGMSVEEISTYTVRFTKDGDGDVKCMICIQQIVRNECCRRLPCDHEFHTGCIDDWLKIKSTCPNCRMNIRPSE